MPRRPPPRSRTAQKAESPAIERSELDALANRVAAVERSEKAVEAELAKRPPAEAGDRSVRLVVAATALKTRSSAAIRLPPSLPP